MGSYASASDVESRLTPLGTNVFSVSTDPSLTEVNTFISQYEAEINMVLKGQGYGTIPATGANDVLLLGRLVAGRVAAEVFPLLYTGQDYPALVQTWIDDYRTFLSALKGGKLELIDQSPAVVTQKTIRMIRGKRYTGEDE